MSANPGHIFTVAAAAPKRASSMTPSAYRMAEYPCGRQVLQGAFTWVKGSEHGTDWCDLPIHKIEEAL